jgi:hypothetical protein
VALGSLSLTLIWLAIVRFGVHFALKSPVIPWTLMLATVGIALWLRHWICEPDASSPESWRPLRSTDAPSPELIPR